MSDTTDTDFDHLIPFIPKIKEFSKEHYPEKEGLHGLPHVKRVLQTARRIHAHEGGSWPLIECIVWLHDIGRKYEKEQKKNHAIISGKSAETFLKTLDFSPRDIQEIRHGILGHSYSMGGKPQTLEAQITSDADKLDALGAVGIFRVCAYQGQQGSGIPAVIAHINEKILKLESHMFLDFSKGLAHERSSFILEFMKRIEEETTEYF
ncbi:HD domain-containing protein [Promethearchaeum syntrophicum]|uniref:HD domain-containing protein n=1 Tax=Promethearchaeum syntrophicum TaxID=2594042 RepID=A0A5B9D8L7_9ARCH|nr:HD domain-containing protein [Candidatus Prometheoarchaeum syntrophicum]QEE15454.1 putative hydrolase [Candidatus Prometheoarchaeum syntrophicum]